MVVAGVSELGGGHGLEFITIREPLNPLVRVRSGKGAHEVVSDMLGLSAAATEEPEQIEVDQGSMAFSGADLDVTPPPPLVPPGDNWRASA